MRREIGELFDFGGLNSRLRTECRSEGAPNA
jgi:hypothetical protein